MSYIGAFFEGNSIFNFVSFVIGLLGLLTAFYFYRKNQKNKIPKYAIRTINIIADNLKRIPVVDILFRGDKISNLSVSKLAFWNDGKDTINGTDVAAKARLRIEVSDSYEILDAEIVFQKTLLIISLVP